MKAPPLPRGGQTWVRDRTRGGASPTARALVWRRRRRAIRERRAGVGVVHQFGQVRDGFPPQVQSACSRASGCERQIGAFSRAGGGRTEHRRACFWRVGPPAGTARASAADGAAGRLLSSASQTLRGTSTPSESATDQKCAREVGEGAAA